MPIERSYCKRREGNECDDRLRVKFRLRRNEIRLWVICRRPSVLDMYVGSDDVSGYPLYVRMMTSCNVWKQRSDHRSSVSVSGLPCFKNLRVQSTDKTSAGRACCPTDDDDNDGDDDDHDHTHKMHRGQRRQPQAKSVRRSDGGCIFEQFIANFKNANFVTYVFVSVTTNSSNNQLANDISRTGT